MPPHTLPGQLGADNSTAFIGLAEYVYDVTSGFFWTSALLAFCVVCYIATSKLDTPRSYGFASFVGLVGAMMLAILQLMPWGIASAFIINGLVGLAVLLISER